MKNKFYNLFLIFLFLMVILPFSSAMEVNFENLNFKEGENKLSLNISSDEGNPLEVEYLNVSLIEFNKTYIEVGRLDKGQYFLSFELKETDLDFINLNLKTKYLSEIHSENFELRKERYNFFEEISFKNPEFIEEISAFIDKNSLSFMYLTLILLSLLVLFLLFRKN